MTDITVEDIDRLEHVIKRSNGVINLRCKADDMFDLIAAARRGVASSLEPTSEDRKCEPSGEGVSLSRTDKDNGLQPLDIAGVKERLRHGAGLTGHPGVYLDALRVIEELEEEIKDQREKRRLWENSATYTGKKIVEAQAEIKRHIKWARDDEEKFTSTVAAMQAEIERLREALKAIAVKDATGPSCVATASAALGEKG